MVKVSQRRNRPALNRGADFRWPPTDGSGSTLIIGPMEKGDGAMSTARQNGTKIVLPRSGPDHFWRIIHDHYAGQNERTWKYLAMLALRENAGWPLEHIGAVFGHPKGHVTRCLQKIKHELRQRFRMSPDVLELTDEDDPTHEPPRLTHDLSHRHQQPSPP